jgi:hypothetical protein
MKVNRKFKVAAAAAVFITACSGSANAADDTTNDKVLVGDRQEYVEYFKQDHPSKDSADKNYLYTTTQVDAPPVGKCIIVTGDSEQAVAIFCNVQGQR